MAKPKSTKLDAQYQRSPNGDEQCAACSMFRPPSKCTAVKGAVSPQGWCRYFQRKKDADAARPR